MKKFTVGVFPIKGKTKTKYTAYTIWYDKSWSGCCEHNVEAKSGADAKKIAIQDHKNNCENNEE